MWDSIVSFIKHDWFTFDIEESIELIDVCYECIWRGVKYFDVCNEMIIESIRIVPNEWSIRWLVLNDYWLIHLNEWRMNTFMMWRELWRIVVYLLHTLLPSTYIRLEYTKTIRLFTPMQLVMMKIAYHFLHISIYCY